MIYTIGSWEITAPVEINADDLTEEENALLMRLFELGCGPRDGLPKGSISLSYNRDRNQTQDEWRAERQKEIEEMCRRSKE